MHRWFVPFALVLYVLGAWGCAGGGDPLTPGLGQGDLGEGAGCGESQRAETHLWGLYDVHVDIEEQSVVAVPNRQAMFTANVVNFLNSKPAGLSFHINKTAGGPDYVDVDIDVAITHPFPGLPQYHGYDVRGVFMGDGSLSMKYNPELVHASLEEDQFILPDPEDGFGGPDGYTRWFNYTEFLTGGMPLFSYTPGKMATPGFAGTATLNPYKYFADSLATTEGLWDWLVSHPEYNGQFSSGATNDRNYYLRFPNLKGVVYGYAIIASWEGTEDESHPANTPEAVGCKVVDESTVWFVDPTQNGGDLRLDISVFDWGSEVSAGVMEDYKVFIESTVLIGTYEFNSYDMTPVGGNENYSTYRAEIPADDVKYPEGNEFWVIVEYPDYDYTNEYGVINDAWEDPLAAFFRHDLEVSTGGDIICDVILDTESSPEMPYVGWATEFSFDASGSYDPGGADLTFEWDFDGDGVFGDSYDGGTDERPIKVFNFANTGQVCVRISNGVDQSQCCVDVDITAYPTKNIDITNGDDLGRDIAIDHTTGDVLVYYEGDDSAWTADVRRYFLSDYYTTYEAYECFWASEENLGTHNPDRDYSEVGDRIDVNSSGDFMIAVHRRYNSPPPSPCTNLRNIWTYFYASDGTEIAHYWWHDTWFTAWQAHVIDAHAFTETSGARAKDMGLTWEYGSGYVRENNHATWLEPSYVGYPDCREGGTGYRKPPHPFHGYRAAGSETDRDTSYLWIVMRENTVAWLWQLNPVLGSTSSWVEVGPRFGTYSPDVAGGATPQPYENASEDDDDLYCAQDITRDNESMYYVLDRHGLDPYTYVIKTFTYTLSPPATTAHGSFGDSSDWANAPIRIEGSDYDGKIVVLHVSDTTSMISVFLEDETPE